MKNLLASAETSEDMALIPGSGRSLEKEMATHSNLLASIIPGTEEPGRLQSMGLQRVRHDWSNWAQNKSQSPSHSLKDISETSLSFLSHPIFPFVSAQETLIFFHCFKLANFYSRSSHFPHFVVFISLSLWLFLILQVDFKSHFSTGL